MADINKLDFKPGDPVKAADLQAMRDALRNPAIDVRGGTGIDIRKGPRGQLQITGIGNLGSVGVASGNISKRVGTVPGTGTVSVKRYDGTNLIDSHDVAVLNASSSTMTSGNGIDSGQYCWIGEDADGNIWVVPLECS